MPRAAEIRNVLLCEDIRREISRKLTLIGIYSGDVLVPHFPAFLDLAFYIEMLPRRTGEIPISIDLKANREQMANLQGSIQAENLTDPATIIIDKTRVVFERPSKLQLRISIDGERSRTILTKEIRIGDITA